MSNVYRHDPRQTLSDLYQYIDEVGGDEWLEKIGGKVDPSSDPNLNEGFRRKVIISLVDSLDDLSKFSLAIKVLELTASEFGGDTVVPDTDLFEFRYLDALIYHHASELGIAEVKYRDLIAWTKDRSIISEDQVLTVRAAFADLLSIQGKKTEAEAEQRDILKRRRKIKAPRSQIANSQNSLSILLRDRNDFKSARRLQCLAYKRSMVSSEVNQATVLSFGDNLVGTLIATGELQEARAVLQDVIAGRTTLFGESNAVTQKSVQRLQMVQSMEGHPYEAIRGIRKTIDILTRQYGKDSIHVTQAKDNLAYFLIGTGQIDEAVHILDEIDHWNLDYLEREVTYSVRATTRRSTVTSLLNYQNTVLTMCLMKPTERSTSLALRMVLTWKKFLSTHEEYATLNSDPDFDDRMQELRMLRSDVARIANQDVVSSERLSAAMQMYEIAETNALRSRSVEKSSVGISEVQKALPNDGVLLEFRFFDRYDVQTSRYGERRLSLAVLPKSGKAKFLDLGPAAEFELLIAGISEEMMHQNSGDVYERRIEKSRRLADTTSVFKELSLLVLSSLLPILPADTKTLVISSDGNLQAVPFEALIQHTGRPLIEQFDVRYVQTGRDLLRDKNDKISNGFVGVCDAERAGRGKVTHARQDRKTHRISSFDQPAQFDQLPCTVDEIEALAELYQKSPTLNGPSSLLVGTDATRTKFFGQISSPGILHFALHGVLIEEGENVVHPLLHSGLVIGSEPEEREHSDGSKELFFALEAPSLDLGETSLVVLSACETGLGVSDRSEGLEGLARSFLSAGARAVMVALWPVEDRKAMEFMIEFYRYWLSNCLEDPGKALSEVKRQCVTSGDPNRSTPSYWAPFVMFETGSLSAPVTVS